MATVLFNNGNKYPILGLGTWKSKPGIVSQVIKDAIDIGYRHIDCAPVYENEKEIGEALSSKIREGVVKREEIFVTSKLWSTKHRPELVEPTLRVTLKDLRLDYLDLYLIHWPSAFKECDEIFPTTEDVGSLESKIIENDIDYLDTWKAMEKLVQKGLVKNIGISNFNKRQIERLLSNCSIKPVTNQVECHPYLAQVKLSDFCKSKDINITAYGPFRSPDRPFIKPDDTPLLEDQKIKSMAAKYKKTPGQIVLRYQIERGHMVIPKSSSKKRMQENFNIFDFKLSQEDVEQLNSLDCNGRVGGILGAREHKDFPFHDEF